MVIKKIVLLFSHFNNKVGNHFEDYENAFYCSELKTINENSMLLIFVITDTVVI